MVPRELIFVVMNVWQAAAELARQAKSGALATVARARGSTPVPAGTKMLVGPEGRLLGSVGGGCVEAEVIGVALEAQAHRRPAILTHHLNADLAGDLGLSCGGTVDIFVEPLVADEQYVRVLELAANADSGLVRTATAWDRADGPVKTFEPLHAHRASGAAATLTRDGRFVEERLTPAPRVFVFGAGHVGTAIASAAAAAGFRVVVIDDRADYADASRFPGGVAVLAADVDVALTRYPLTAADAVVIATRGRNDALILERVAPSPAGYVGLLGSRRKKIVVTKGLKAAGVPAKSLQRVRVPVGLPIGAVTPEEIAVSVVAELISWRRGES